MSSTWVVWAEVQHPKQRRSVVQAWRRGWWWDRWVDGKLAEPGQCCLCHSLKPVFCPPGKTGTDWTWQVEVKVAGMPRTRSLSHGSPKIDRSTDQTGKMLLMLYLFANCRIWKLVNATPAVFDAGSVKPWSFGIVTFDFVQTDISTLDLEVGIIAQV